MARDRKRARQRRDRAKVGQRTPRGASAPGELHRADLPAALDHGSAEVDEFDAALVRGAGGAPMPAEPDAGGLEPDNATSGGNGVPDERSSGGGGDRNEPVGRMGASESRGGGVAVEPARETAPAQPVEAPERAVERREPRRSWAARAVAFLRASWAELQRVQWPDRPQVSQATAVVLGFVAVAGLYLGLADWVAQKIVNFIL